MEKYQDRVGGININTKGTPMKIVKYSEAKDIDVEFQDEYKYVVNTQYINFLTGQVKNPFDKSVFNVGYIGVGKHKVSVKRKNTEVYKVWKHMIERCYDEKIQEKYKTYIGCSVDDKWLNFQNFAQWYEDNYYKIDGCRMQVDKDILVKGNKLYSPETCVFVPYFINAIFANHSKVGKDTPVGVYLCGDKYGARCSNNTDKQIRLGYFNTPEEAFQAYKQAKEAYIKEVAEQYKGIFPEKLYLALINYEVDIDD